jgi:hypothetical protein
VPKKSASLQQQCGLPDDEWALCLFYGKLATVVVDPFFPSIDAAGQLPDGTNPVGKYTDFTEYKAQVPGEVWNLMSEKARHLANGRLKFVSFVSFRLARKG